MVNHFWTLSTVALDPPSCPSPPAAGRLCGWGWAGTMAKEALTKHRWVLFNFHQMRDYMPMRGVEICFPNSQMRWNFTKYPQPGEGWPLCWLRMGTPSSEVQGYRKVWRPMTLMSCLSAPKAYILCLSPAASYSIIAINRDGWATFQGYDSYIFYILEVVTDCRAGRPVSSLLPLPT